VTCTTCKKRPADFRSVPGNSNVIWLFCPACVMALGARDVHLELVPLPARSAN